MMQIVFQQPGDVCFVVRVAEYPGAFPYYDICITKGHDSDSIGALVVPARVEVFSFWSASDADQERTQQMSGLEGWLVPFVLEALSRFHEYYSATPVEGVFRKGSVRGDQGSLHDEVEDGLSDGSWLGGYSENGTWVLPQAPDWEADRYRAAVEAGVPNLTPSEYTFRTQLVEQFGRDAVTEMVVRRVQAHRDLQDTDYIVPERG